MKTINKLSILLIVCSLIMLCWHPPALPQQAGDRTVSDSMNVKFPLPDLSGIISENTEFPLPDPLGIISEGDSFTIGVSLNCSATMMLVKVDEPDKGIIKSISTSFSGGTLIWEIPFDDLGLPPGRYEITESFTSTLSGISPHVVFNPLEYSTDFGTWVANFSAGATIIVNVVATIDNASVSGDFTGPLEHLPSPPPSEFSVRIRATRDIPEIDDEGNIIEGTNIISYSGEFTVIADKETSIIPAPIHVPGDYPTIQAGIDAASDGDTVLVADRTYTGEGNKNLDFRGKDITVTSENGAEYCIIDCEDDGRGFYFHSKETPDAVVDGFTIKNGWADRGGGIYCADSSPTIRNNIIIENFALDGGGIYCGNSSNATILSNVISSNTADNWGGGIAAHGSSSPIISNNVIAQNSAVLNPDTELEVGGGAISLDDDANAIIVNNTIDRNYTEYGVGGGILCGWNTSPIITNNIIVNSSKGVGIWVSSVGAHPVLSHNDVWNNTDGGYAGISPGIDDISIDPFFVDAANRDYHLSNWSPCIGKGIMTGDVPTIDKDGNRRPNPPSSNPDIGAYEHFRDVPLAVTPGDVSGNGRVTAYDAVLVLQYVVGFRNLSLAQRQVADVTGDDNITALDVALILQDTVGLTIQSQVETR